MKRLLLLPIMGALFASCNSAPDSSTPQATPSLPSEAVSQGSKLTGKLNVSALSRIPKISVASTLKAHLSTLDGTPVEQTSALAPNTTYKLSIDGAKEVQLRACFGFELVDKARKVTTEGVTNDMTIKTQASVLEPLIVSVIPMQRVSGSLFREQAQTITLTK